MQSIPTQKKAVRRRIPQFELMGGPVCLDFVNTLDDRFSNHPKELLTSYGELARFAEDTQIVSNTVLDELRARSEELPEAAQRAVRSAIRMREAMGEIFYARVKQRLVAKAALALLNEYLQEAARHMKLVPSEGHFQWQFELAENNFEVLLWPIARSAAELLASDQLQFVRACASNTCEWLFLDESKNHRRRWCDMTKCGNRAKVRNFYSRQKKA